MKRVAPFFAERPYLQFVLIGMIILLSGGFWAHLVESHRRKQRQLSDELEQLGFSYDRLDQRLFVHGNPWPASAVTDWKLGKALKLLDGGTSVRAINLSDTEITDSGLKQLAGLTSLEHVSLRRTEISDAGLEYLGGLVNLQSVSLFCCTKITDAGLNNFVGLPKLDSLNLRGTQVTEEGVAKLREALLPRGHCRISPSAGDFSAIRLNPGQRESIAEISDTGGAFELTDSGLRLGFRRVNDYTLKLVSGLTELRHLDLHKAAITDAGLKYLKELTKLESVNLNDTRVTEEGIARLHQALPNCLVIYRPRH